jgi:hypothetical protein
MSDPLQQTLADIIKLLQREGIEYALIGGLAASLRGRPRVTADVDLVIAADVGRTIDLVGVLDTSEFKPLFDEVADVVQRALLLPLRHRSTGVKVDLAIGLSGFEQLLISRAESLTFAGSTAMVATAEDLVIMKVVAGRPQDEQDISGIIAAQSDRLDWDYCLKVAADLGDAIDQDLVGRVRALRIAGGNNT